MAEQIIPSSTHGFQKIHGASRTRLYQVWFDMIRRCEKLSTKGFEYYGGRGISVSTEWHDFSAFRADMGDRPLGGTLERIDNNGNYCKANCRWATRVEQAQNTSLTRRITIEGKTQSVRAWCRFYGISCNTFYCRTRRGWNEVMAITWKK